MAKALRVEIIGDAIAYTRALRLAMAETEGFAAKSKVGLAGVAKGGLLVGAAFGAISYGAVKMSDEFESSMAKIRGLVGASEKQTEEWGHQILQLAPQVGKAPKELADALFIVTSSGLKGEKAMNALTISAKASAAGLGETKVVADAVTSAMNAYAKSNLSAESAADVLVATVREGKTEASALAPVIGNLLPLAAEMGVKFNDVGAAIASQTRVGIDAATSVTNLSATFSTLLRAAPKTEKGLAAVGLSTAGLRKEMKEKGLIATLLTLKNAFHGNTTAMAQAFPNVRALRGVLALVGGNAKSTIGIFERMRDTTGSMSKAFEIVSETGEFKFKQLGAGLRAFMITFGAMVEPVVVALLGRLIPAMMQLTAWLDAHKEQIKATFQAIGTAIVFAFQLIETAVRAIIPVVAQVVTWFQEHWSQIADITRTVLNDARNVVMVVVGAIVALWNRFGENILSQARAVWEFIKQYIQGAMKVIQGIITTVMALIHGDWGRAWEGIKQIFSGVWQTITAILRLAWATLKNVISIGLKALEALWRIEWEAIKAVVSRVWDGIVTLLRNAGTAALGLGKKVGSSIKDGISDGLVGLVKMVQGWFQSLWAWIEGAARSALAFARKIGSNIVHGIWDGITGAKVWLFGKLEGFGKSVAHYASLGFYGSPRYFTYYLGKELTAQLIEAMTQEASKAGAALSKGVKASAVKGFGNAAGAIIAAAKKVGVDARAALAVAMSEGGTSFGAVGDSGTSFGPFQLHIGGANPYGDPAKAAAFANSLQGITYALRQMAAAGAAGKSGFDAIRTIVTSFERPANPAAEIARAISYYKQIPAGVATALAESGTVTAAAVTRQLKQIDALVRVYGKQIGLEQARSVVAGLVQGTPSLVQQAREALRQAAAAMRQQIAQDKASLVSAFRSMATEALAAFDEVASNWQSPAAKDLAKMQAEDAIKGAVQAVADAQSAVDAAVAKLAADQAAGADPETLAQDQADIESAVTQLGAAQRAYTEFQLGLLAAQQEEAHAKQMAADRTHLTERLLLLEGELKKHPEAYRRIQEEIIKLIKGYNPKFNTAGYRLAHAFSEGLSEGIDEVVAAARRLANALEEVATGKKTQRSGGSTGGPGRPPDVDGIGGRGSSVTNASITVNAATDDPRRLALQIRDELRRMNRDNALDPLAV